MTLETRLDQWSRGWRGPFFAALVALIAGLPGVFALPPLDRDESRFAQATAQMLETGDLVVIKFQDQPRFKKPVGIHWLQAASVSLLSAAENRGIWAYRIPSLLGAMLAAAACAWGAGALLGPRTGLLAGSILGATFLLSTEAFIAKTDAALCGATTLALAALARLYAARQGGPPAGKGTRLAFWLGLSVGLLLKGPVGLMVIALTVIMLWAWDRKAPWLKDLGWGWGLIVCAGVVLPWATMITVATDGAFWSTAVNGDLAPKLAGGHESHSAPFGSYVLASPLLTFPATLLLPAALTLAWTGRREPGVRFAVCWLLPAWLVFELLPTKLAHYTLPAFGGLAMLMAAVLRQPLGAISRTTGAVLMLLSGGLFAAVAIYALSAYGDRSAVTWASVAAGLFAAAGLIGALLLMRRAAATALVTAGAIGVLAHAALAAGLAPRLAPLWLSQRVAGALDAADLAPRSGAPGPVAVTGYSEPSLIFLLGTTTELTDPTGAAQAVADGRPAVVEARLDAAFRRALAVQGLTPRPAGVVEGLDYSDGDHERLTLYRGAPQPEAPDQPEDRP